MHICFLVESYHDMPNINGICVENVANEIAKLGNKVTVLTTLSECGQAPRQKVNGIEVYRIHRNLSQILMNAEKKGTRFKRLFHILAEKYTQISAFIHFILFRCWPLSSYTTVLRYKRLAKIVFGTDNAPDILVGTYFHIEELISAIQLKQKYPGCKVMSYLLDAMNGREAPVFLHRFDMHPSIERWEKYMLKNVDLCISMEAHRRYFNTHYDESVCEKIAFADIPLLVNRSNIASESKTNSSRHRLVYTGFTSPQTGSSEYLFKLLELLNDVELHMYGRMSVEVENAFKCSSLYNHRIFFHGYVSNSVAVSAQNSADALVTFGSINRCMISGKIFEYMASKKPIICFYQIDNDINISYLSKYPSALILKNDVEDRQKEAEKISAFLKQQQQPISNELLKQRFIGNIPYTTAQLIINAGRLQKGGI